MKNCINMDFIFKHKRVQQYMTPDVRTIDEKETVFTAVQTMTHYNISCLIVTRDSKAVGIVTERDIMRRVSLEGKDLKKIKIKDVMSTPLISKNSKTTINEVIALMSRYGVRRLVIMDEDELKGIVTQTDIVRMSNKYIEVIDIVKLYFYFLIGIGVIAATYLIVKAWV